MKPIDIQISQAQVSQVNIDFKDGKELPDVTVAIDLLTPRGKRITNYSITTRSWASDETRFELPPEMIGPICELAQKLERIVTNHCQASQGLLTEGDR